MALRLTGETPGVVQGLDDQGWPRMASPGSIDLRVGLLRRPGTGVWLFHPYHYLYYSAALNAAIAADTLRASTPIDVPERWEFDGIGINIGGQAGSAGAELRLGLYKDDGSGVYPGALEFDAGFVDATTTGDKTIALSPTRVVRPGRYYLVLLPNNVTTMPQVKACYAYLPMLGVPSLAAPIPYGRIVKAQAYGALPNPFPSGGAYEGSAVHLMGFKLASVG